MLSTQFGAHAAYLIGAMIVGVFGASATVDIPVLGTFANWRAVFVCVGIPGLVIAPLMAFTTKEARRQALAQGVPNLAKVVADLGTNWRLFAGLFVGVGINAAIVHAFGTWLITYLIRTFQWTASDAGYLYGMVGLVASMGGAAFLPAISGMVERAGRKDALILTAVVSIVLGNLCAAAGVLSGNPVLTTLMVGPAIFSTIGAITLVLIALHDLSPPGALGTLCALQVLSGSALGMAIGPPLTAFLTDSFYAGPQAMQWALATVPLLITPVSLALIGGAYRPYLAHRARRDDGESEN